MAYWNSKKHHEHVASYNARKKNGFKPVLKPWYWITLAEVSDMAKEAYLMASHDLRNLDEWPSDPAVVFAERLADAFQVLTAASAQSAGIACMPANAQHYAKCMRSDLSPNWRPQYPMYQKVTPASAANASGVVITADEGNGNGHDFKP